jgi:signal transduction histidine kinase
MEHDISDAEAFMSETRVERQLEERQDQLLMTLGHELKTPITVIKGTVQLAHHRLAAGGHEQEAAWLEIANIQINRLAALVDYLLRAGQLNSAVELHLTRFDLADLIRGVGLPMQTFSTKHTLIVQTPEDLAIEGDQDRLEQVVRNLITNAIKYSPAGGNVEITLRRSGGEAELCVRDYGIGIPSEDRAQVFERFARASNVGLIPGFGLGLSMSRDIVQAHHGRLWVGDLSAAATAAARAPEPLLGDAPGSLFCLALPFDQDAQP